MAVRLAGVRRFAGHTWIPERQVFRAIPDLKDRALALRAAIVELSADLDALEVELDDTAVALYDGHLGKLAAIARWCGWSEPNLYYRMKRRRRQLGQHVPRQHDGDAGPKTPPPS